MRRRQLLGAIALAPAAVFAQALPPPLHGRQGLIRIAGTRSLAPVVAAWAQAFTAANPAIRIEIALAGSDLAMAGLYTAQCDIALIGRGATKPEVQAFEWIYRFQPRSISVLTGSVATPGCSPAIAAMVHRSNPLASLRLDQLRAAFGDNAPRARVWGDLGLGGAWRDHPINLYAPDAESGTGRYFRESVLGGSNRLAWARMREFSVPPRPEGAEVEAGAALRRALARDPLGLAIGLAGSGRGYRVLPLIGGDGVAHLPDAASIASGEYPLSRSVQAYFAHSPTATAHAEIRAFLGFTLSEHAQALAASVSDYLALTATAASSARTALETSIPRFSRVPSWR